MMTLGSSEIKMPVGQHSNRIDTFELKAQIERKLGRQKADKYFNLLNQFLSLKLSKSEFHRICIGIVGRENLWIHNRLVGSILKNACISKAPPPPKESKVEGAFNFKATNGFQRSCLQSLCRDVFPQSPRKGRNPNTRDRKFRDRLSPLGPNGKINSVAAEDLVRKIQEQQSATELLSLGSRPPGEINSVEDGEEVDQAAGSPGIYSRSPVKAPLGIPMNVKATRKSLVDVPASALHWNTCQSCGELPDASSLRNRLEQKLGVDGFKVSADCIDLLNCSLDAFLKRLINPCLAIRSSRADRKRLNQGGEEVTSCFNTIQSGKCVQESSSSTFASILDFRTAMELNPHLLGGDWPIQLEKICLLASEE